MPSSEVDEEQEEAVEAAKKEQHNELFPRLCNARCAPALHEEAGPDLTLDAETRLGWRLSGARSATFPPVIGYERARSLTSLKGTRQIGEGVVTSRPLDTPPP